MTLTCGGDSEATRFTPGALVRAGQGAWCWGGNTFPGSSNLWDSCFRDCWELTHKGVRRYKEHKNTHIPKLRMHSIFYSLLPMLSGLSVTKLPRYVLEKKKKKEKKHNGKISGALRKKHCFFNNAGSPTLLMKRQVQIAECPVLQEALLSRPNSNVCSHGADSPCPWGREERSQGEQHEGDS